MADYNKNQNQNSQSKGPKGNETQVLVMMGLGLVALWIAKNEVMIKTWLFDNMFVLILIGIAFAYFLGKFLNWKFKRKNKDFLERAEQMQALRAQKSYQDFYQKPQQTQTRVTPRPNIQRPLYPTKPVNYKKPGEQ